MDIERASSFIKYTTINKGFIPLHGYFIFKSLCNLIFSYPYASNVLSPHNQHGFYGPRQVLHFAPFKQCALIIIMWVLQKFVLVYGFIMPCVYCILGFCSMMNVYRIINYLNARICPTSFNHGKGSKIPFHSCPKPHHVPFFK